MLDKEHQIRSSPWPEKSSSLVREAWHMKSQCNPVRWLNDGVAHGSLNSAWEEKGEDEQGRPPKHKEVWMEEICREASRIISCLMTHCGSLLLHGSQDCICLIQKFLVSLQALPKMAFWPLLLPSPPVLSPTPLLTVPQPGLAHPYIFILAGPVFFVRNAHYPPFCPLSSYSPFKIQYKCHLFCDYFPTSGQSQHLWHCIVVMCLPL